MVFHGIPLFLWHLRWHFETCKVYEGQWQADKAHGQGMSGPEMIYQPTSSCHHSFQQGFMVVNTAGYLVSWELEALGSSILWC